MARIRHLNFTANLAVAAVSQAVKPGYAYSILAIIVKASGSNSETLSITYDSPLGTNYDTLIATKAFSSSTDIMWQPTAPLKLSIEEGLLLTSTDAGSDLLYGTVIMEEI